jgi:hypothetical protein
VAGTGAVGTMGIIVGGDITVAITGVSATGQVGDVGTTGGTPVVTTSAVVGHVGKPKRKRHYVEIDGQYFEVRDEDHAVEILTALHEEARKAAPVAVAEAAKVEKEPVIPRMTVVKTSYKKEFVKTLQDKVDETNTQIEKTYLAAQKAYRSWQLAEAARIAREDDDTEALLLMEMFG